jgi:riboflavin synthase
MFTGIVEETGLIRGIRKGPRAIQMSVETRLCGRGTKPGDSLAVNGCCLTVTRVSGRALSRRLEFDLLHETWKHTSFRSLRDGSLVNLERALRADSRLGGHFVTGHIDGTGRITRWEKKGADHLLDVSVPAGIMRHVVHKGSICVEGISLTVAAVRKSGFRLWIIPHTLAVTALRERGVGDPVNLETDLLGKYVERFVKS